MKELWWFFYINYTPTEGGIGVNWIHPDVCPSVRPSVCRQGFRNFLKKLLAQFISYHAFTLEGWVSWLLFIFVLSASYCALWLPNFWPKIGFPELFEKTIGPIHFIFAFTLMGWVFWPLYISVFLASFSALWWPNIWPKMGVPDFFVKTIGSIHFIPGIYPNGVSLLTPTQFRVSSLIFGPLVAKYLCYNDTWLYLVCVFSIDFAILWQFFYISQTFYLNCCDTLSTMTF